MTIEKILEGICPSCNKASQLEYRGIMKDEENDIILYNCMSPSCFSTIALSSFYERNPDKKPTA